ncbi:CMRF35-like molecule 8 isoform X1 [Silurus meridionalis]|uniref:CMRF35-like molecule 8 isoform X1 n=1 Tax=Silurus meridionalis TaxID=175797 RepID=UPI001EEBD6FE|nr:CMRF35-like molecule 8 isoform X1 [Silurus meridionalis]
MMKCLYFLSVVFHVAAGCELSSDNDWLDITSYKGRSVLLPCSCSDLHSKPQKFTWMTFRTGNWTEVLNDEQYNGRYQLFNNTSPANLSLLISDLREEDQEVYRCSTEKEHRDITLYVKGCELVNKREFVNVTGFTGESVVLPCFCTDLQDDPKTIKWFSYGEIYPEQTGHYKNRVKLVRKNPPGNLSLLISNLTEEDQGTYWCNVQNDWSCVRLYVKVGKRETSIPSKEKDTTTPLSATSKTTQDENLQETTTNSPTASSSTTQDENIQETTTNSPTASSSTTQVLSFFLVLLLLIPGVVAFIWWNCKGRRSGEYVMNKGNLGCKGKQKDQIFMRPYSQ